MSLRERLRSETAADHKVLDQAVERMDVFSSVNTYARYLEGMHELYRTVRSPLDRSSSLLGIPPSAASLMIAIQADWKAMSVHRPYAAPCFADIGCQAEVSAEAPLHFDAAPTLTAAENSEALAAAYVMEGSAMGARMMQRIAEKLIKATVKSSAKQQQECPDGLSYLTTVAKDSYRRWPTVIGALESANCDHDAVINCAKTMFASASKIFAVVGDNIQADLKTADSVLSAENSSSKVEP